jgi:metal-responsive CopG/Arc/MetJ family transcriptional regulator
MKPKSKGQKRVTIKVPRALYDRIDAAIQGAHFNSVTEFIVYVLRDVVSQSEDGASAPSRSELDETRRRLKNLGYL